MYYFKYKELITNNNIKFTLDKGNFVNKVKEYVIGVDDESGGRIFIVEADLNQNDLLILIKIQKVELQELDELTYNTLKKGSEDYSSKRKLDKTIRRSELENAVVTFRNEVFDADEESIQRMTARLTIYNTRYILLRGNGVSRPEAFKIYDEILQWKTNSGKIVKLTVRDLARVAQLATEQNSNIMLRY